jgi:hypothetical protein
MAVMRISGHKKKEVTGGWMKLHNELRNLYSSHNSVGKYEWKSKYR